MSQPEALPDVIRSTGRIPTLRGLCFEVPTCDERTPLSDVELLFRNDPELLAVTVTTSEGPRLLSRRHMEAQLGGRLGFGRALLARAAVGDIVDDEARHLDADTSLRAAAETLVAWRDWLRDDEVLVVETNGALLVASVAAIFREVGLVFREIALRDPLTGLPNRRMLDEYGATLVAKGAEQVAVLYVDLDGFKQVNDLFGHQAGDELLVAFARRLMGCIRPQDIACRMGGDEFAVLLADTDETDAMVVAERIVESAQRRFVIEGRSFQVSASVGVATSSELATVDPHTSGLDGLLQHADGAMLHAKRSGKGRLGRLEASNNAADLERRARIRRRLPGAIERGELCLFFQPKLDLRIDSVTSFEALLRWHHEALGDVSPVEIVAVAEQAGHIAALTSWVLRAACAQVSAWLTDGREWGVAVNVPPVQLATGELVEDVLRAADDAGVPRRLLQVEVTESRPILDLDLAIKQLRQLQDAGIAVHLDDFGSGYSSPSVLRELPLDSVKIDRSIIDRVDTDPADARLAAGMIEAAHLRGLEVVAEGVEREAQLSWLRDFGCDYAQGYLIGRPAPPD